MHTYELPRPGVREVSGVHIAERGVPDGYAVVERRADRDTLLIAPRRLATLYRWLTLRVVVNPNAHADWYRFAVTGINWSVAWVAYGYFAFTSPRHRFMVIPRAVLTSLAPHLSLTGRAFYLRDAWTVVA